MGASNVRDWIEEAVASTLRDAGIKHVPTEPSDELLRLRRITERREIPSDLAIEAQLRTHRLGFCLVTNPKMAVPGWRTRFTIFHEIAHTFFFNLETSPPTSLYPPALERAELERLCNRIAGAFILPPENFGNWLEGLQMSSRPVNWASAICDAVRIFHASPEVVVRRMVGDFGALQDCLILCVRPEVSGNGTANETIFRIQWSFRSETLPSRLFIPANRTGKLPKVKGALHELLLLTEHKRAGSLESRVSDLDLGNVDSLYERIGLNDAPLHLWTDQPDNSKSKIIIAKLPPVSEAQHQLLSVGRPN